MDHLKIKKKTKFPYSEEEKIKLFAEGHVRSMSKIEKNPKAYKRKSKNNSKI